jgi:ligand-binding sensor domain-containing protein
MKRLLFVLLGWCSASLSFSQSDQWRYFRSSNTGVAGEEHVFLSDDRYGNIWTGGRSIGFTAEGSVVRFNPHDTIFTCWSDFEGYLPSDIINDAEVDSFDVLWVATAEGLVRNEGGNWTTFNMQNTPLPSSNIRSVAFDSEGRVWISFQEVNMTIGGIASFDGNNWEVYTTVNSDLPHYECRDVLVDGNNTKWIFSQFSVTRLENGVFTDFNNQNSAIFGIQISDVSLDENGLLYVVSQGAWSSEIAIYNGIDWEVWDNSTLPIMNGYFINAFEKRGERMAMAGGYSVLIFDGVEWTAHPSGGVVYDVLIDQYGDFWASTYSSVSHFTADGWKDYARYSSGISEDFNENIFTDSQGRVWVANGNGGIHVFECPKWQMFGPFNQGLFPSPQTLSYIGSTICEDSDGNIWFAYNSTSGTVVKIPNGNYKDYDAWEVFDGSNSPVSWIEESVADGHGHVFFYSDYGTYMYDNATQNWTFWDLTNSPLLYYTDGFGADNAGRAFFGGFQQLAIYDNGTWSEMNLVESGTTILTVNDIAFDTQNHMWLGCEDGLWMWDSLSWHHWNMANSEIVADHITSVEFSDEGELWVSGFTAAGFLSGGISQFDFADSTWHTLSISNSGLPAEQIDDLEFDALGNLWVNAYPKGVAVYNSNGLLGFECMNDSLQTHEIVQSVTENQSQRALISIYPNPTKTSAQIQWSSEQTGEATLLVYDMQGKLMLTQSFQAGQGVITQNINCSSWKSGGYHAAVFQAGRMHSAYLVKVSE